MTQHEIIFDLDNCLFDTQSMGKGFLQPIVDQLAQYVTPEHLEAATADLWRMALSDVLMKYQIPKDCGVKMETAYQDLQVPNDARIYPDVLPTLRHLNQRGALLHLVTKGYRKFQTAKLQYTGIHSWFSSVHIVGDPTEPAVNKHDAFVAIKEKRGSNLGQYWVIGDGPEEIAAGNSLGMHTVQTLRPGIPGNPEAQHHVDSLDQLCMMFP